MTYRGHRYGGVNNTANHRDEVECIPWVFEVIFDSKPDDFQNRFDSKERCEHNIDDKHDIFKVFRLTMGLCVWGINVTIFFQNSFWNFFLKFFLLFFKI